MKAGRKLLPSPRSFASGGCYRDPPLLPEPPLLPPMPPELPPLPPALAPPIPPELLPEPPVLPCPPAALRVSRLRLFPWLDSFRFLSSAMVASWLDSQETHDICPRPSQYSTTGNASACCFVPVRCYGHPCRPD